jgi:hypothetical protein
LDPVTESEKLLDEKEAENTKRTSKTALRGFNKYLEEKQ